MNKKHWTKETSQWLYKYNQSNRRDTRSKIYSQYLELPLRTIVEVLVSKYLFNTYYEREDLINECLSFLQLVLPKIKKNKSSRDAYNYLYVSVKHFLWHRLKKQKVEQDRYADPLTMIRNRDGEISLIDSLVYEENDYKEVEPDKVKKLGDMLLNHWTKDTIRTFFINQGYSYSESYTISRTIRSLLERHYQSPAVLLHKPSSKTMEYLSQMIDANKELLLTNQLTLN